MNFRSDRLVFAPLVEKLTRRVGHDKQDSDYKRLARPIVWFIVLRMDLIYPINFVGHDEWMNSGYALGLAGGDVITRDGEVLGVWRVVDYDPKDDDEGGRYEFMINGQDAVKFSEEFAHLDFRASRGLALSTLTRAIREWQESQLS
jgi:hypothetical protein